MHPGSTVPRMQSAEKLSDSAPSKPAALSFFRSLPSLYPNALTRSCKQAILSSVLAGLRRASCLSVTSRAGDSALVRLLEPCRGLQAGRTRLDSCHQTDRPINVCLLDES